MGGFILIFRLPLGRISRIALGIIIGIIFFISVSGLIYVKQIVRSDGRLLFLRYRERRRMTDGEQAAYCCCSLLEALPYCFYCW
jgi:hypothetical protein